MESTIQTQQVNSSHSNEVESPFALDEMFFSRTDARGVIESGNEVFFRVSEHPLERLVGSPHNMIRHPDMPKAVFQLFWDTLKKGDPIGAYVKNRSATGKIYWVFAVAWPTESGYVSIRIKPSSPLLGKVSALYREMRTQESQGGIDRATQLLVQRLSELGFESYSAFMVKALRDELRSRDRGLETASISVPFEPLRAVFDSLEEDSRNCDAILNKSMSIQQKFKGISYLSINMTIDAERIGEQGRTLSEVSDEFKRVADEIRTVIEKFSSRSLELIAAIQKMEFAASAARLQSLMSSFVSRNLKRDDQRGHEDQRFLLLLATQSIGTLKAALQSLAQFATAVQTSSSDLRTLINGLEVIRISGKIEISKHDGAAQSSLTNHLHEMAKFIQAVSDDLRLISTHSGTLRSEITSGLKAVDEAIESLRRTA